MRVRSRGRKPRRCRPGAGPDEPSAVESGARPGAGLRGPVRGEGPARAARQSLPPNRFLDGPPVPLPVRLTALLARVTRIEEVSQILDRVQPAQRLRGLGLVPGAPRSHSPNVRPSRNACRRYRSLSEPSTTRLTLLVMVPLPDTSLPPTHGEYTCTSPMHVIASHEDAPDREFVLFRWLPLSPTAVRRAVGSRGRGRRARLERL